MPSSFEHVETTPRNIKNILSRCLTWVEDRITPARHPKEGEVVATCMLGKVDVATVTNYNYLDREQPHNFECIMHPFISSKLPIPSWNSPWCNSLEKSKLKVEQVLEEYLYLLGVDKITQWPIKITWEDDTRYIADGGFIGKLNGIDIAKGISWDEKTKWKVISYLHHDRERMGHWSDIAPNIDEAKFNAENAVNEWFTLAGLVP